MVEEVLKSYARVGCVTVYNMKAENYAENRGGGLIVTDPPFNIGYKYDGFSDRKRDYLPTLAKVLGHTGFVLIHYAEAAFAIAAHMRLEPSKCVAWVYPSNTRRQWRMISWFGIKPDFKLSTSGEYKNKNDKRIRALVAAGRRPPIYDWWEVNQVKNVSKEKLDHPCQMPLRVMLNVIEITPAKAIIDPYAGTGTTGEACLRLGRPCTLVEQSEKYCEQIALRLRRVKL